MKRPKHFHVIYSKLKPAAKNLMRFNNLSFNEAMRRTIQSAYSVEESRRKEPHVMCIGIADMYSLSQSLLTTAAKRFQNFVTGTE